MESDTQQTNPNEMIIINAALFILAYYVADRVSKILDKPLSWVEPEDLAENVAYDENLMNARIRSNLRCNWIHSKILLLLMAIGVMQTLQLAYSLANKCRWSQIALKLAEHYKTVDPDSRPNIFPYLDFVELTGIFGYTIILNLGAVFVLYKLAIMFDQQLPMEVLDRANYAVVYIIVLLGGIIHRMILLLTFSDGVFIKLFKE